MKKRLNQLPISRRDFLNGMLIGAGGSLLSTQGTQLFASALDGVNNSVNRPGKDWYGYGGVGDYALSHGNTPELLAHAHDIRDGRYKNTNKSSLKIDEEFDVVIIGGGLAGLGAGMTFQKQRQAGQKCLILENHPVFGGEAKRNEFGVNGVNIFGPQGGNGFSVPSADGEHGDSYWYRELDIPREFDYQTLQNSKKSLGFSNDNMDYWYGGEDRVSTGHFFSDAAADGSGQWLIDPWRNPNVGIRHGWN